MVERMDAATSKEGQTASKGENRGRIASLGAIGAASLASVCCIGPVLFVTLGVGAGLARQFEPLRPIFTILMVALMVAGFYSVYGRSGVQAADRSFDADGLCRVSRNRARDKIVLWTAALIALVLLTFPRWSLWIL